MSIPLSSRLPRRHRRSHSGSTLAVTMCIVALLITFLSIAALITSQFGRYAGRQQGDDDLRAAADAGMEYAYAAWRTSMQKSASLTTTSVTVAVANLNSTTLPFAGAGITFNSISVGPADANGLSSTAASPITTYNVPNYPGWSGQTYNYVASVQVQAASAGYHYGFSSDASNRPVMTYERVFQYTTVPLFQAAIFYENTLEIHPGAAMTVVGLVHTNADLWARGFSMLKFMKNVSYVSSYHEIGNALLTNGWDGYGGHIIPGVGSYAGVPLVTWSDNKTSDASTAKASQLNQVSPIDPFGGASTNDNGLHDIVEKPATVGTNTAIAYNNAAAVIAIDSSQPLSSPTRLQITDNQGHPFIGADLTAFQAAVNSGTTTTMYDQREGQNVVITTLDMTKLLAATSTPTTTTVTVAGKPVTTTTTTAFQNNWIAAGGGTIYIHDTSPVTATEPAIRLVNGRNLGQNITVASDNGVYIQGDYNTGGTSASSVPSNAGNNDGTLQPNVNGYNRYSSAVLADAVTILSNSWSDNNAGAGIGSRTASPTTVNTAILAGDVASNLNGNANPSGGAHNFPRFLENWNGKDFTYTGSLVEAYRSEEFTGLWQTGNVYYWPNRWWNFDTNFITKPPPGTASGIQLSRGRWQRDS